VISRLPFDELRETAGKVIYTITPAFFDPAMLCFARAGEAQEGA